MKLATFSPQIRFEKKWSELSADLLQAFLFLIGGMLLARWIWLIFSPTIPILPSASDQTVSSHSTIILAGNWFAPSSGRGAPIAPASINFKLVGIYAPSDKRLGFAVFKQMDGKQRAVLINQEITPGIMLLSIMPESVQIGQEGSIQILELEKRTSTVAPSTLQNASR
jgi:hypothetical protein